MSRGADAAMILKAIMAGRTFEESGVEDTPHARQVWESMKRDVENVPPGDTVDIPHDWSDQ